MARWKFNVTESPPVIQTKLLCYDLHFLPVFLTIIEVDMAAKISVHVIQSMHRRPTELPWISPTYTTQQNIEEARLWHIWKPHVYALDLFWHLYTPNRFTLNCTTIVMQSF